MTRKKIKSLLLVLLLTTSLLLQACGSPKTNEKNNNSDISSEDSSSTDVPTDTPADEPADTPADEPADTPADEPADTPADEPADTPADEPADTPADEPADTPADEPADTPADVPGTSANITLDLTKRISVWGQDIGIDNADGSVTYKDGTIDKCSFPLPSSISANDTITVTAKLKFESADDKGVRFYLTDDALNNCTAEIIFVKNTGADATETTITLKASQPANAIMFAASEYGVQIQNVTICSIVVSGDTIKEPATPSKPADPSDWLSAWATTEEKCNLAGPTDSAMPKKALEGTTIRQIIRITVGGDQIRFRLSNQYGESDVEIKSMHVAKQSPDALSDKKGFGTAKVDMSTIVPSTDTVVSVNGETSFVIPKGEVIITDPINISVNGLDNLAVSMHFGKTPTTNITGHRGARATTYQVDGDQVSAEVLKSYQTTTSWFFLADCSVLCPDGKAIVLFGDSITDGYGTDASYLGKKPDSYTRYADYLAKRLQENEPTKNVSVLNEGLGANSILGAYPTVSGRDRFARDILEHDKVEYVIILFGVNDIGKITDATKHEQLIPEYKKMVDLCHENGIKVFGAPILPFGTSNYYTVEAEAVRVAINDWMRSEESGFDGIIPFDEAVADKNNPKNISYIYTKADGLHPYEGYSAMANAVDLNLFVD